MVRSTQQWLDPITREDVEGRAEAARLLPGGRERALVVARAIRHPWYRCQAITGVAEATASTAERSALVAEALAAACEQAEPNRVVNVAGWPLRVLVQYGDAGSARVVDHLLRVIADEPHGLRRLDGVAAILGSVIGDAELRALAWPAFLQAAAGSAGWRTERIVACMAEALAAHDLAAALRLLESRPANRFVVRARSAIDASSKRLGR